LGSTTHQASSKQTYQKRRKTVEIGINGKDFNNIKTVGRTFDVFVRNLDLNTEVNAVVYMFSRNEVEAIEYTEIPTRLKRTKALIN
jgi:hypothetical protein